MNSEGMEGEIVVDCGLQRAVSLTKGLSRQDQSLLDQKGASL